MAIFNIQEILHPSDSNQIKWEKVNYNFDQILANGGGPIGKKGNPGDQGSVGQTGQKGDQGEIGPQGLTGETTSRWKVIPINNGTAQNEYVILKPKVSTDNYHPVIFLGDQDFNDVQDNNGRTNLRSTIVVGKHAVGGNSPSDELITYWHGQRTGTSNNIAITLSTSEQTDGNVDWTRFTLAETYGANLNTDPAEIIEYFVELDKFTFKSNVSFDSNINNTFKLPETNVAAAFLEAGMIRFRDGAFWGAIEDGNGTVSWKEFCTAPCGAGSTPGTVAIVEQPADLNLNQYGGIIGNTVVIDPSGDLEVDENGDPWTGGVQGCTDPTAQNYDPNATVDDGSCIATIYGCTDPAALNYYAGADEDDGSCYYATNAPVETIAFTGDVSQFTNVPHEGGTGEITYNTTPTAGLILSVNNVTVPAWITINSYQDQTTFDPELNFTIAANATGVRTGNIVIQHPNNANATDSMTISQVANPEYGQGCTDPNADNYDPNATGDDGSCTYCANFAKNNETPVNPTTYGGNDGQFTMTATGGSGNYDIVTYLTSNDQTVNTFALAAGTYYSIITDITNGCTDRHDFTLTDPATSATTAATNATAATTAATNATAATTLAAEYTAIVANPSGTVDEGQNVSITVTGNYIPNGTRVWVNMNLGQANQLDVTSGWSSGAGAGDSPSNSSWGNWVTMNNNTGSHTITIKNDNLLEGGETITFSLLSYDEAGNATGSKQTSVTINDTSYPQTHTVTFINGNTDQYSTCQMTSNTKTATYAANPNGQATWTTIADAIMNDSDYAGSGGVWFKIVSSTEPGFQWNNTTANHSAPITGQDCSNVTTSSATTTASSGGGSGTECWTYNLYNAGSYTVSGTLNNVPNCSGSGNVGIYLAPYQSVPICTDTPISGIYMGLASIGGTDVTVSQSGSC